MKCTAALKLKVVEFAEKAGNRRAGRGILSNRKAFARVADKGYRVVNAAKIIVVTLRWGRSVL